MEKASRNDPCPCGSNLKFKKCCITKKGLQNRSISLLSATPTSEDKAKKLGSSLFAKKTVETPVSTQEEASLT